MPLAGVEEGERGACNIETKAAGVLRPQNAWCTFQIAVNVIQLNLSQLRTRLFP